MKSKHIVPLLACIALCFACAKREPGAAPLTRVTLYDETGTVIRTWIVDGYWVNFNATSASWGNPATYVSTSRGAMVVEPIKREEYTP